MALDATRELIRGALEGDARARGELLERLRPRLVLWVASRMSPALRAKIEPDDLVQEILIAVHGAIDRFHGDDDRAFFGWLFRIAENRIRDQVDHFGAKKRQPVPPLSFSQTSPSARVARAELVGRLREAIAALPESYREVVQRVRLEEQSVRSVAEQMGRSENAVRILYCRALKALRAEMDARSSISASP